LTYTWQERERKYYTNEGNKSNDNARKITTQKEQQQELG
jgi:hypothetical protein